MKKTLLIAVTAVLLSLAWTSADAVPARPEPITVQQADGSFITIRIYGDEKFNYTTTSDGYLIVQRNGIYYHAAAGPDGLKVSAIQAHDPSERTLSENNHLMLKSKGVPDSYKEAAQRTYHLKRNGIPSLSGLNTGFPTKGKIRSLVILANFKNCKFESETAVEDFTEMLNQEGYTAYGATGSARDYYLSNSSGVFDPQFDVVGPVELPYDYAHYGKAGAFGHDDRPDLMITDACRLADKKFDVDFSDYDYNNDGLVDNVFVFYAGENEAEGGGSDRIWPHRSEVIERLFLDGKQVFVYACTSEFCRTGASRRMAGIGTFCHEFGHVLSFSDLYDTDGSSHGSSLGVFNWSIMCVGSYNNDGRTPPALNGMERLQLGWTDLKEIELGGDYSLESIEHSNTAYVIPTDIPGEFFVLENRQPGDVWDNYLGGHGLLIFHVDKSDRIVEGINYTAAQMWDFNMPNVAKLHECYRVIRSTPEEQVGVGRLDYMPFPGKGGVTEFSSESDPVNKSWSGKNVDIELFDIQENNGIITFRVKSKKGDAGAVESVTISGRDQVILNDTVVFKAILQPEVVQNAELVWSSSDPETVSIDQYGFARALKVGNAEISATTVDGQKADRMTVRVIDGQLFRAKVQNSATSPFADIEVTLDSGIRYSGRTDEKGILEIENIPQGDYETVVEIEGYVSYRKQVHIGKGVSACEITMLTEKEMKKGTGDFDVEVLPFGTYSYLSCSGSKSPMWKAEYYPKADPSAVKTVTSKTSGILLEGMTKDTEYVVKVIEMSEVAEGEFRVVKLKTTSVENRHPLILLGTKFRKGDVLDLNVGNVPDNVHVYWSVDGEELKGNRFKVTADEHLIKAFIEKEDCTDVIIKYIKAK